MHEADRPEPEQLARVDQLHAVEDEHGAEQDQTDAQGEIRRHSHARRVGCHVASSNGGIVAVARPPGCAFSANDLKHPANIRLPRAQSRGPIMRPCLPTVAQLRGVRAKVGVPTASLLPSSAWLPRWWRRPSSRRRPSTAPFDRSGPPRMPPAPPIGSSPFSRRASRSKKRWSACGTAPTTAPTCRAACSSTTTAPWTASSTTTRSSCPGNTTRRVPIRCASTCTAASHAHVPLPVNRIRVDALPSGVEEIRVFPNGWVRALWWSSTQVDNLARILDRLKRTYNIDENRVYLTGTSDGGTGVYYMAFRDPTAWASFRSPDWQHAGARHAVGAHGRRDVSR